MNFKQFFKPTTGIIITFILILAILVPLSLLFSFNTWNNIPEYVFLWPLILFLELFIKFNLSSMILVYIMVTIGGIINLFWFYFLSSALDYLFNKLRNMKLQKQ
jgi:hypothetical protein